MSYKFLFLYFSLFSLLFGATDTTIKFKYYDIYPHSQSDIQKELNGKTPIVIGSKRYHGYTETNIKWHFKWEPRENECKITEVQITLDVLYTMPQIPSYHKVDNATETAFKKLYAKLMQHEENHKELYLKGANEIESSLMNLSTVNCSIMNFSGNELVRKIWDKYRDANQDYDYHTNHGILE